MSATCQLRRRILFVENGAFGGGSAESLAQLLSGLDRERFEPLIVFTSPIDALQRLSERGERTFLLQHWYGGRPDGRIAAAMARLASVVVNYGARWLPDLCLCLERSFTRSLRKRLAHLIGKTGACLVHTNNNPHRDLWAIEAAAATGTPCISHLRSFHGFGFTAVRGKSANAHAAAFIAYSRSIAEYWIGAGLNADQVCVVPNAIGAVQCAPSDLAEILGVVPSGPVIGLIGRVIPERGHDRLLAALPQLRQEFPDIRLLVVGGGETALIRRLVRLSTSLGVADAVVFTGHRPDALGILAALDALILPYNIEPFGRTLLEAWQLGVPTLLSRVGHITDVVEDGDDALLFDPAAPGDLEHKLGVLLRDQALRVRLASNAKRKCAERFSIAGHCRQIEAIYSRVLERDVTSDASRAKQG